MDHEFFLFYLIKVRHKIKRWPFLLFFVATVALVFYTAFKRF